MTNQALVIVLVSSVLHATWNLILRHGRQELTFLRRMLVAGVFVGAGPALACEIWGAPVWQTSSPFFLWSGLCGGIYFVGMGQSYVRSDFTIVYPVARAMPVLLVAVGDLVIGRAPTPHGWIGMLLVVVGCFLAPLTSLRGFNLRAYCNPTILWMLLAAIGTTGYSLIDKAGALDLRKNLGAQVMLSFQYVYYYLAVATVVYLIACRFMTHGLSERTHVGWVRPAIAAAFNFLSYGLIVWVYQLTNQASYVVAARQFSIVIAVVAAFVIYQEPGKVVRTGAALIITTGLIILGWG